MAATSPTTPRPGTVERPAPGPQPTPSELIDARIDALGDWRGGVLRRVRTWIADVEPDVVEAWKWRGVPVWERDGMICTGETYATYVKLTFHKGAHLADPAGLFNASLDGNMRRAIDIGEHDELDEAAFKALVVDAIELNQSKVRRPRR